MFRQVQVGKYNSPGLDDKLLVKYDASFITKSYINLSQTATGSSGGSTITMSSSVATVVFVGMLIRLNGTDEYTVTNVVTTTVTISGTLSTNYVAVVAAVEKVSTWTDLSKYNYSATQSTNALKPLYIPSGVNSLPTIRFNSAASTIMSSPVIPAYRRISGGNSGRQHTMFFVSKQAVQDVSGFVVGSTAFSSQGAFASYATTGSGTLSYQTTSSNIINLGNITTTNFALYRVSRNGIVATINMNRALVSASGVADDNSNNPNSIDVGGNSFAGSNYLNGEIAEIQIYNKFLSDADVVNIENGLSTKYNITLT